MSVIARRTVSILPASTSERRVSRSRRPWTCVESKIRLLSIGSLLAALLPQFGLGPFDSLELLLRRLGDEVVTAVEGEVGDHDSVHDRRPDQHPGIDEETSDHRSDAEHKGHARGEEAAWRLVGTLEVRLSVAQDDVREHHQDVRDRRPEDGDQDEQGASFNAAKGEQKADDTRHDQCYPRHVTAAGYREPPRKVPCPREREDLARVGVDKRIEARDQTSDTNDVDESKQGVLTAVGAGRGERVGKRRVRCLNLSRAPTTGSEDEDEGRKGQQGKHCDDQPSGHIPCGVAGLFGCERQALYAQKEPDRVRERRPDAQVPQREESARAGGVLGGDVEQVGRVEVRDHPDHEHDYRHYGRRGDNEHYPQGLTGTIQQHPYEDRVEEKIDHRPAKTDERLYVPPDKGGDGSRSDRHFDHDRRAREEPSPHPHGPSGETVAGPGDRDGGREFGQGVDHGGVHDGREDRGDEQATPSALGEPELPARNLPGNDVCHPESRQKHPARRTLLQLPLLQVFITYMLVLDPLRRPSLLTFTHLDLLFPPVFPRVPYQPRNDRDINGNRYSRQQSVGEISFSRIAQPSMMAYLWTVLETRTSFIRTLQRRMDCLRSAGKTSRRWTSGSARSSRPSLSPKPGSLR